MRCKNFNVDLAIVPKKISVTDTAKEEEKKLKARQEQAEKEKKFKP